MPSVKWLFVRGQVLANRHSSPRISTRLGQQGWTIRSIPVWPSHSSCIRAFPWLSRVYLNHFARESSGGWGAIETDVISWVLWYATTVEGKLQLTYSALGASPAEAAFGPVCPRLRYVVVHGPSTAAAGGRTT